MSEKGIVCIASQYNRHRHRLSFLVVIRSRCASDSAFRFCPIFPRPRLRLVASYDLGRRPLVHVRSHLGSCTGPGVSAKAGPGHEGDTSVTVWPVPTWARPGWLQGQGP
jgi:hypothetical protein